MVELSQECFVVLLVLVFTKPLINLIQTLLKLFVYFFALEKSNIKAEYGDWAVVTGATDGIGKEYAKELAKRNLNLILISRTLEKLNKVKNEIQTINPTIEVKVIQADFSKGREELARVENHIKDMPIGILVNNVGRSADSLENHGQVPDKDVWDIVTINDGATVKMTHMVVEEMKKRRKGAIVNISSGSDMMPIPMQAEYAASKIFVTYFSKAIRAEYAGHGITVQCLSPFYIDTNMAVFAPNVKKHRILYPNAERYVRSAVRTLGIFDDATGYWTHEIIRLILSLAPVWLRTRYMLLLNRSLRREYYAQKHKETAVKIN